MGPSPSSPRNLAYRENKETEREGGLAKEKYTRQRDKNDRWEEREFVCVLSVCLSRDTEQRKVEGSGEEGGGRSRGGAKTISHSHTHTEIYVYIYTI